MKSSILNSSRPRRLRVMSTGDHIQKEAESSGKVAGAYPRQEVPLEELWARSHARFHPTVDRLEPAQRGDELAKIPVEGRLVGLEEDERVSVDGERRDP